MATESPHIYFATYDLPRRGTPRIGPVRHQSEALTALRKWYDGSLRPAGAIVSLPTGGGKTFTAVRFLATEALSDGYKVLWLAHTHHLLEQAFEEFREGSKLVTGKEELRVRVVSGATGHWPISRVEVSDDVVIGTIQTVRRAVRKGVEAIEAFLEEAGDRLIIVFDEAHHSPANTYRKLLMELREKHPGIRLLGLTATPTYSDEAKRGWLGELFPQGIIASVSRDALMAERILARPHFEEIITEFTPSFEERDYRRWVQTNRDLPEDIIEQLAGSAERNAAIADHYVANRERYGRTIIFADRWFQCESLQAALEKRGVRAGSVYSHVESGGATAEERNARTRDTNDEVLAAFKRGDLDVICNIRMLTEGTDVPSAQTVFLTRKTTSQILLTQMVGRALRGPRFGGTDDAYIVSFNDHWPQLIHWAKFDDLTGGTTDDASAAAPSAPLELIRIDLVRRLARQLDSGMNVNDLPYTQMLPAGWFRVDYEVSTDGDEVEPVSELLVAFDVHLDGLLAIVDELAHATPRVFEDEALEPENDALRSKARGEVERLLAKHLPGNDHSTRLLRDVLAIGRHMAQRNGERPRFYPFEDRDRHDLDAVAQSSIERDLGPRAILEVLEVEYRQSDLYWNQLYPTFQHFKHAFDGCMNRLLSPSLDEASEGISYTAPPCRELCEDQKEEVKARDGYRCLACGYSGRKSYLHVDHIRPFYRGGETSRENSQTLCKRCNELKSDAYINFCDHRTDHRTAPTQLVPWGRPTPKQARSKEWWEMFVRGTLNFFYGADAVQAIELGARGSKLYHWRIQLYSGNDASWLEPFLNDLIETVRNERVKAGLTAAPDSIEVRETNGSTSTAAVEAPVGA